LASKLKALLGTGGLMEYSQTWKQKVTPAGRLYWAHTASGRRTFGNAFSGWPTPAVQNADGGPYVAGDGNNFFTLQTAAAMTGWPTPNVPNGGRTSNTSNYRADGSKRQADLAAVATLTGWNTPRATDGENGGPNQQGGALPADAAIAGWGTPSSRDGKDAGPTFENDPTIVAEASRLPRQVMTIGAKTSSIAKTARRGVLNPRFSLWLMGFPAAWASCGELAMQSCRRSRRCS